MLNQLRASLTLLLLMTLLLGILYPLGMTGFASAAFPAQAAGSLVTRNGTVVGSALIGQAFSGAGNLHPRPSAAGTGYDAAASSGTNLAPTSAKLAERLRTDAAALKAETGAALVPADAVTTSGSGLDPDISPAYAALQVPRIAAARNLPADEVSAIIAARTTGRTFGLLGEPRVNVLGVNLDLDAKAPAAPAPAGAAPPAGVPAS